MTTIFFTVELKGRTVRVFLGRSEAFKTVLSSRKKAEEAFLSLSSEVALINAQKPRWVNVMFNDRDMALDFMVAESPEAATDDDHLLITFRGKGPRGIFALARLCSIGFGKDRRLNPDWMEHFPRVLQSDVRKAKRQAPGTISRMSQTPCPWGMHRSPAERRFIQKYDD